MLQNLILGLLDLLDHGSRSWLRHSGTNRKVMDSIPDGIFQISHCLSPTGIAMALGSTQPLIQMDTRDFP